MTDPGGGNGSCRINGMLKSLARVWVADIIHSLAKRGETRFGSLRRNLGDGLSARVLSVRLKELEAMGLVDRMDAGTMPLQVTYTLTTSGRKLDALLRQNETSSIQLGLLGLFEERPERIER